MASASSTAALAASSRPSACAVSAFLSAACSFSARATAWRTSSRIRCSSVLFLSSASPRPTHSCAAGNCVERGLALDKNNTDLQRMREEVRQAVARAEKLHAALKNAETAHAEGRLDAAKAAVEEALAIAPDDSHAKSLYRLVQREWAERARQQQIENYVSTARQEIAARRFTAALEVLRQAQTLDPDAPQVQALVESAILGQTQERRG